MVDNQNFGWGFQLLFGITTLCTGYGLAGLTRRFLVWPAAMIWPGDLVNTTLFYILHDDMPLDPAKTDGWRMGRYRWFLYVMGGGFVSDLPRGVHASRRLTCSVDLVFLPGLEYAATSLVLSAQGVNFFRRPTNRLM